MDLKNIVSNWGIVAHDIVPVRTGIFNETHKIYEGDKLFILQKLHPLISSHGPTKNYVSVTDFLRERGFPTQEVLRTVRYSLVFRDGRNFWRMLRAIPGTVYTKTDSLSLVREAGKCLGKTHSALADFPGRLANPLPMFQYDAVLKKLKKYKSKFKKDKNRNAGYASEFLLEYFPKHFLPAGLPKRLIHTDPKISNFIFDSTGRAVSMIDWDTAQKLNPLYDIGDAIRSLCGKEEDDSRNIFDLNKYKSFLSGYKVGSREYLSSREKKMFPRASALVILGLAGRFLNDYAEDFYFGWNKGKYKNRKEHNLARTLGQIALYKDFSGKIDI